MTKSQRSIIITILQLRIAKKIVELTKLKEGMYNGWIYPTEVTIPLKISYTTLGGFLDKLKKKGVIQSLQHLEKLEWGGVFRLTRKGKIELENEINAL
jgi:DNA-binding PadR family transcriptional regulator